MAIRAIKPLLRSAALCLLLLGLGACTPPADAPVLLHTHSNEAGELWGTVDGGEPRLLASKAQAYRPLGSPDGKWLAVEVRQLSNLDVVQLFRVHASELVPSAENVTALAWRQAAAEGRFDPDDIIQPRVHIAGWDPTDQSLSLALSADLPGQRKPYSGVVVIALQALK